MLKKIMIMISLFTFFTIYPNVIFAQKKFRTIVQYGNLMGISLGSTYAFNNTFSIDAAVGTESPLYIIWASPYSGNKLNFSMRSNISHRSGFYVS